MTARPPREDAPPYTWPDDRAAALEAWIGRRFPDRDSEAQRRARARRSVLAAVAVVAALLAVLVVRSVWHPQFAPANARPWLGRGVVVVALASLVAILVALARSRRQHGLSAHERYAVARLRAGERRDVRAELRLGAGAPAEDHWALDVVARTWWLGRWQVAMFGALAAAQLAPVEVPPGIVDVAIRAWTVVTFGAAAVSFLPGVLAARSWLRRGPR